MTKPQSSPRGSESDVPPHLHLIVPGEDGTMRCSRVSHAAQGTHRESSDPGGERQPEDIREFLARRLDRGRDMGRARRPAPSSVMTARTYSNAVSAP